MKVGLLFIVEEPPLGGLNWSCVRQERREAPDTILVRTSNEQVNCEFESSCRIVQSNPSNACILSVS